MVYLIPIPIVITAFLVKIVSVRYKLKFMESISNIVIAIGTVFFIYHYAKYCGFDISEYLKELFSF